MEDTQSVLFLQCVPDLRIHLCCDVGAHLCFTGLDLLPFTVTFLLSFWQVQYGIIGGVATSGVLLLYNVARPQIKVEVNYDISKDKAYISVCGYCLGYIVGHL